MVLVLLALLMDEVEFNVVSFLGERWVARASHSERVGTDPLLEVVPCVGVVESTDNRSLTGSNIATV